MATTWRFFLSSIWANLESLTSANMATSGPHEVWLSICIFYTAMVVVERLCVIVLRALIP